MKLENLSPEIQEIAKSCTSVDELKELCKKIGAPLSEEELEAIAGGSLICRKDSCSTKCAEVLA